MSKKSEAKEIMPLENINAVTIFKEGGLDDLLKQISKEASSHVPDLTTETGRKEIASNAYKVAQSKVLLDDAGKKLVAGAKAEITLVDNERKRARDTLDVLRDEVRKPLNEWEAEEELRVEGATQIIQQTIDTGRDCSDRYLELTVTDMKNALTNVNEIIPAEYDEFEERMTEVKADAITKIERAIELREKHDADQAELEALRKKNEEREEADRRQREADEQKKREDKIADGARKEAEKKAEDDKKRIEEEKQDAIDETERVRKQGIIDAEKAAQKERDKIAEEQRVEREAAEKREADVAHRKAINNSAVKALIKTGLTKPKAIDVVTDIAKGHIPNVTISY